MRAVPRPAQLAALAGTTVPLASCGSTQSALKPESHASERIADLWWLLLVISVVVLTVVTVLVLAVALRARGRRGDPAAAGEGGGTWFVALAGAAVPAVVLVALFVVTVEALPATSPPRPGHAALTVDVRGRTWFWEVAYRGTPARTANEIHIPARTPVRVRLSTGDVIHSFWIPELNRKVDMIPHRVNSVLLDARRPGVYRGQCAEFCGLQHAHMSFLVIAQPPAAFRRWLRQQARPAARPTGTAARGRDVFLRDGCAGCHTIRGTSADGRVGPDLTHVAGRSTLAANTIPNRRGYLAGWIVDPQHVKPGNLMPATNLSGPDLQALLDYLEALR